MKFLMMVMANKASKANQDYEAGKMPSEELLSAMGKYNEELMKAGVLVEFGRAAPQLEGVSREVCTGQTHHR